MQKLVVFSLLAFIIYYPNQSKASTINQANNLKNATIGRHNKKVVSKDSLRFFTVDDFPVTNRMFRKIYNHNQSFKMKSGKIYSLDKAWFTNDTLDQTLVFELYTDFFRTDIYLLKTQIFQME